MCENPDKTVIGNIERGFDFLGYHFGRDGLSVAKNTIENVVARAIRLYEQEPGEAFASIRFGLYVQRWARWVGPQRQFCDWCARPFRRRDDGGRP